MSGDGISDVHEESSRGSVAKSWSLGSQGVSRRPTSSARVEDSEERSIEEFVERILGGEYICKGALSVLKVHNSGTRIIRVARGNSGKQNDARTLALVQSRSDTSQLFINKLYSEPDERVSRTWKLRDLSSIAVYHNPTEARPHRFSELSLTMDRRVYRFRVPSTTYCRKFIGLLQDNCKIQYGKIPDFQKNRPLRLFVVPAALRPGSVAEPKPGTSKERDSSESGQWPTRDASTSSSASPSPQLVRSFEMLDLRNTVLASQSTTPGQIADEEEISRLRERERIMEDRERLRLSKDDMEAFNDVLNLLEYDWKTSSGTLLQRIRVAKGVLEMETAADVLADNGLSTELEQLGKVARQIEEACQPPSGGSYSRIIHNVSEKIEAHKTFVDNAQELYETVNKVVESTTLDEQESRLVLDLKSSEGNLFDSNPC
uniref:Exocyst complex component Sec3 PIP2-binding N-terminal domain-containing protein n=2 Tax=Rhodosorus marinus TaxID=101924 RepID=A0A7S3EH25_9RHOD|mmetsp:Transcript_35833/g.143202  ORF Transcript_35833/g.143202 Transcript_35833/m.143202 type:complete len:431 (+) Transcript_35833:490-1782(+)